MLYRFQEAQPLDDLSPVLSGADLQALLPAVRAVHVARPTVDYLLAIVRATREHPEVELGASPRAALALFQACQARAAIRSRAYVQPDDVKALAVPALAHRLLVTPQGRLRGQDGEQVVADVVAATPVPVEGSDPGGRGKTGGQR
jgi:MoxR-like ATPase